MIDVDEARDDDEVQEQREDTLSENVSQCLSITKIQLEMAAELIALEGQEQIQTLVVKVKSTMSDRHHALMDDDTSTFGDLDDEFTTLAPDDYGDDDIDSQQEEQDGNHDSEVEDASNNDLGNKVDENRYSPTATEGSKHTKYSLPTDGEDEDKLALQDTENQQKLDIHTTDALDKVFTGFEQSTVAFGDHLQGLVTSIKDHVVAPLATTSAGNSTTSSAVTNADGSNATVQASEFDGDDNVAAYVGDETTVSTFCSEHFQVIAATINSLTSSTNEDGDDDKVSDKDVKKEDLTPTSDSVTTSCGEHFQGFESIISGCTTTCVDMCGAPTNFQIGDNETTTKETNRDVTTVERSNQNKEGSMFASMFSKLVGNATNEQDMLDSICAGTETRLCHNRESDDSTLPSDEESHRYDDSRNYYNYIHERKRIGVNYNMTALPPQGRDDDSTTVDERATIVAVRSNPSLTVREEYKVGGTRMVQLDYLDDSEDDEDTQISSICDEDQHRQAEAQGMPSREVNKETKDSIPEDDAATTLLLSLQNCCHVTEFSASVMSTFETGYSTVAETVSKVAVPYSMTTNGNKTSQEAPEQDEEEHSVIDRHKYVLPADNEIKKRLSYREFMKTATPAAKAVNTKTFPEDDGDSMVEMKQEYPTEETDDDIFNTVFGSCCHRVDTIFSCGEMDDVMIDEGGEFDDRSEPPWQIADPYGDMNSIDTRNTNAKESILTDTRTVKNSLSEQKNQNQQQQQDDTTVANLDLNFLGKFFFFKLYSSLCYNSGIYSNIFSFRYLLKFQRSNQTKKRRIRMGPQQQQEVVELMMIV